MYDIINIEIIVIVFEGCDKVVIKGIVTNKGIGVSGISVELKMTSNTGVSKTVTTGENGKFKLEPNEITEYVIEAGYNDNGQPYGNSVLVENKTQTINIELLPTTALHGFVYDSNKIPLHNCRLVFKTDELYYISDNVKNGVFYMMIPKNQHYSLFSNVLEEDKNAYINIGDYSVGDNGHGDINIYTDFAYELPVIREITYHTYMHPFDKTEISVNALSKSENEPLKYEWKCDDGKITGEGKSVTWEAPEKDGTYEIIVEVTDSFGLKSSKTISIDVGPPLYEEK